MPKGKAQIIGDNGDIYDDPPEPVGFIASKYPAVSGGMEVYFERRADNPYKAKTVRPWTMADSLAALVIGSSELTHPARRYIGFRAAEFSARVAEEPGAPPLSLAEAEEVMALAAARFAAHQGLVGIAIVRATFEEL